MQVSGVCSDSPREVAIYLLAGTSKEIQASCGVLVCDQAACSDAVQMLVGTIKLRQAY